MFVQFACAVTTPSTSKVSIREAFTDQLSFCSIRSVYVAFAPAFRFDGQNAAHAVGNAPNPLRGAQATCATHAVFDSSISARFRMVVAGVWAGRVACSLRSPTSLTKSTRPSCCKQRAVFHSLSNNLLATSVAVVSYLIGYLFSTGNFNESLSRSSPDCRFLARSVRSGKFCPPRVPNSVHPFAHADLTHFDSDHFLIDPIIQCNVEASQTRCDVTRRSFNPETVPSLTSLVGCRVHPLAFLPRFD